MRARIMLRCMEILGGMPKHKVPDHFFLSFIWSPYPLGDQKMTGGSFHGKYSSSSSIFRSIVTYCPSFAPFCSFSSSLSIDWGLVFDVIKNSLPSKYTYDMPTSISCFSSPETWAKISFMTLVRWRPVHWEKKTILFDQWFNRRCTLLMLLGGNEYARLVHRRLSLIQYWKTYEGTDIRNKDRLECQRVSVVPHHYVDVPPTRTST